MAVTVTDLLGTIRDNASDLYISRVPEYNKSNLGQIGDAITEDKNIMNEFINALVNKIAFSNIVNKTYKNPLSILKGTEIPYGNSIEEIYINPAVDSGYSTDGNTLLTTVKPDGKVCYYALNRKSKYEFSVNMVQLQRAFTNEQNFMEFYNKVVIALYSGDEMDEFILCKNVVGKTIDKGSTKIVNVSLASPKEFAKAISNCSKNFTFPSKTFNGYNATLKGSEKPCITWCDTVNQCLLITAEAQTSIDYDLLATFFNIPTDTLERMTILVDEIPSETATIHAVLCDKATIQMRDNVFKTDTFYNGGTMETKLFLHHWETIYFSMFGNAVAFGTPNA